MNENGYGYQRGYGYYKGFGVWHDYLRAGTALLGIAGQNRKTGI